MFFFGRIEIINRFNVCGVLLKVLCIFGVFLPDILLIFFSLKSSTYLYKLYAVIAKCGFSIILGSCSLHFHNVIIQSIDLSCVTFWFYRKTHICEPFPEMTFAIIKFYLHTFIET